MLRSIRSVRALLAIVAVIALIVGGVAETYRLTAISRRYANKVRQLKNHERQAVNLYKAHLKVIEEMQEAGKHVRRGQQELDPPGTETGLLNTLADIGAEIVRTRLMIQKYEHAAAHPWETSPAPDPHPEDVAWELRGQRQQRPAPQSEGAGQKGAGQNSVGESK